MITRIEHLADIRNQHKNETIALTSGTFDLLHVGHLEYLAAVKALGDIVVVMVSGDDRVKARKGLSRPIEPEDQRTQKLDALRVVDYVFIDPATAQPDEIDPIHAQILEELQPDIYATDGPDPRFWDIMDRSKFVILDRSKESVSTTDIINRILSTQQSN